MRKNGTPEEDQLWFQEHIGVELEKLDAAFEPMMPQLESINELVTSHKRELRRKLWKELGLFWLIGLLLLTGMMWVIGNNLLWFVALQVLASAGAFWYIVASYRKKGERAWRKS
ncbi:DUF5345 family protein [Paenibacillus sp. L3-i20]|uniref:DUF5345 family protein n=1 Tax=Paenibacillus sp. L3-i20 TaxID=2905833 RepID=UPI001EDEB905|nr:DUF5345 family protein [Paenibacillus sp. L3-i20]GKU76154.1 hypothetical protein L3i20_v205510 [Paenibacillus sp. L3-i20]